MGIGDLIQGLADNPYFGAGFGLFGIGAMASLTRKASQGGLILVRRHLMTTLEVTCKDKSYPWLLKWISQKGERVVTLIFKK